jgi:hypothetical protein
MTIGKASAVAAGLVGAVILAMAIGPMVTNRGDSAPQAATPAWDLSQASTASPQPIESTAPVAPGPKVVHKPQPKAATVKPHNSATRQTAKVPASAPALGARLKPVLNRGANMLIAADGFRDAEQFASVAHAARNTRVPFMVLKHHVVEEKQSLADALGAANPKLDAAAEARRARTEAQADIKAVAATFAN